jgi:hypothetical protein
MIIGEGTSTGLVQSVIPKPPNVKSAYPLINREPKLRVELPEDIKANGTYIHVYVF